MDIDNAKLAKMIDHTILKADATPAEVEKLCAEAAQHHFASVCVNSSYASLCARLLGGSDVMVCAVVGFPLGAMATGAKAYEAELCAGSGAKEVDMVIEVGRLKAGDFEYVKKDIAAVVDAVKGRAGVKVIIETCLLNDDQKRKACLLAKEAGAAFVKTSTGFSTGGATAEDIRLMRETVGPDMGVKASGGVRTREDALKMIEAGASRIGASSSIAIIGA